VQLQTANGVVTAPLVRLHSVDVGGNRARDVAAVVHPAVPPPLDGVIGLSFLDHFTYAVDPRRHILRLR
jgi:predicted aspartyl protease